MEIEALANTIVPSKFKSLSTVVFLNLQHYKTEDLVSSNQGRNDAIN